jgi:hypothetical protein
MGGYGVRLSEAKLRRVETVGFVDTSYFGVARGSKFDVDARVKSSTVYSQFDDLNRGLVANLDFGILGKRHLRQAHSARIGAIAGAENLEGADHGVCHVLGSVIGTVCAKSHVDVHKSRFVTFEPARLEGDGATGSWPVRAVPCIVQTAAFEARAPRQQVERENLGRLVKNLVPQTGDLQGNIHCMPYGKVSLVMRLFPRQPG